MTKEHHPRGPVTILTGLVALALAGVMALSVSIDASREEADTETPLAIQSDASTTRGAAIAQQGQQQAVAREDPSDTPARTGTSRPRAAPDSGRDGEMPAAIGQALTNVIELLDADRITEARAELDALMTADLMSKMSRFQRSRLYQLSFNLNMQEQNWDAARADLEAALDSGGLNAQEANATKYQIAQLLVQTEDYAKAADHLESWIAQPGPAPNKSAYYLLAASYYYQERFDDARDHMETLMTMPGEKQEPWYAMLNALYLQQQEYAKAKPVLEKMVELYGRDAYREQLNAVNAELARAQ